MENTIAENLAFIVATMRLRAYLMIGLVVIIVIAFIVDYYIINPIRMRKYWEERKKK